MRKVGALYWVVLAAAAALFAWSRTRQGESIVEDLIEGGERRSPNELFPSDSLRDMLKKGERLVLTRYRLGDGGWTLGYGRFFRDGGAEPPVSIDESTADRWFNEDVEARGARWVRQYVTVPLLQHEFDALTHMAYNLSPGSFAVIANEVNAGGDPEEASLRYVRAGTNLERGLRIRRGREIALFRNGEYHV